MKYPIILTLVFLALFGYESLSKKSNELRCQQVIDEALVQYDFRVKFCIMAGNDQGCLDNALQLLDKTYAEEGCNQK